jgi:GDPmannose 4,6-dehydratase
MIALVFGINGQDGYYLNEICKTNGISVIGVSRTNSKWYLGDVSDFNFVESLIKVNKPDYIFHLAANSTTRHDAIFENHESISTGTLNILEAAYRHSPHSRIFLSGSAMQFRNNNLAINESTEFHASSPYSVARIQSVYAGRYFREKHNMQVYAGYFFNHDSPLRNENHVNQKIVRAAQRIANGSKEILEIGNIKVQKEFNFAGDMMEAVWHLVNQDKEFELVLGSGKPYSIEYWIQLCFEKLNLNWKEHIRLNENFVAEYDKLYCNPSKLYNLSYSPQLTIEELAYLMLRNFNKL